MVAGVTLRISPEPMRDNPSCERLACPTERLRGESETTAVYRFTSRTDEATPLAATRENSSRAPSAFWKLPGPGRPPAPCPRSGPILALTPQNVCPPPPTPALYAGHAACDAVDGSETSALPELQSPAYDFNLLLESKSINRFFSCRARDGSHPDTPRPHWRILRIRFTVTRPFRPRLAGMGICP